MDANDNQHTYSDFPENVLDPSHMVRMHIEFRFCHDYNYHHVSGIQDGLGGENYVSHWRICLQVVKS